MRRFRVEAIVLGIVAVAVIIVAVAPAASAPRAYVAVALVLALPGFACTRALMPRAVKGPERVLLALTLSVVAAIAVALLFRVAGLRLTPTSWTLALSAITVGALAIAVARDAAAEAPSLRVPLLRPRDSAMFAVAIGVVVAALALGTTALPAPAQTAGHTALWMLPDTRDPQQFDFGVEGGDLEPTTYRLVVTVDGRVAFTDADVEVRPSASLRGSIRLPVAEGPMRVVAELSPASHPDEVLRRVTLTTSGGLT